MKRREFNKKFGMAVALSAWFPYTKRIFETDNPFAKIAMSTVNFRERFRQTRAQEFKDDFDELTLLDIPEYFGDRFGLSNVEFWSKHFDSIQNSYLSELKKAIKKNKSRLINIQLDESYEIGSPDDVVRKESLALVLKWVDAAKILGSGAIRVNPGNGEPQYAIEALKIINKRAMKQGLILMVENHFGMEMDPAVHLKIIKEVGKNIYTLPDFGNYDDDKRYESLKRIMPYAYQISAKTMTFDEHMNHMSFDFDRCMQIAKGAGFKGIYSVEQWSPEPVTGREEAIADWMIEKIKNYL